MHSTLSDGPYFPTEIERLAEGLFQFFILDGTRPVPATMNEFFSHGIWLGDFIVGKDYYLMGEVQVSTVFLYVRYWPRFYPVFETGIFALGGFEMIEKSDTWEEAMAAHWRAVKDTVRRFPLEARGYYWLKAWAYRFQRWLRYQRIRMDAHR